MDKVVIEKNESGIIKKISINGVEIKGASNVDINIKYAPCYKNEEIIIKIIEPEITYL